MGGGAVSPQKPIMFPSMEEALEVVNTWAGAFLAVALRLAAEPSLLPLCWNSVAAEVFMSVDLISVAACCWEPSS